MKTANIVTKNRYQDSVTLMQVAVALRVMPGIEEASLMMGTEPNKEILGEADLLTSESIQAGPNDLILALRGSDEGIAQAHSQFENLMRAQSTSGATTQHSALSTQHSIAAGLVAMPSANLVLISTPGIYAAAEAHKALSQDRHVMIFSDNVSLQDEVTLKQIATERGLLLMGPDCGTAIIGGVPLGFANAVRRGPIGVVGASGTGMQEITTLIDRYGGGISHAIGTGSRDLSSQVGALSTLAGLAALRDDPATKVIVIVSKPPAPDVAAHVISAAKGTGKSVVVCFLGLEQVDTTGGLAIASTLEEAARKAIERLSGGVRVREEATDSSKVNAIRAQLQPQQRYVRGLFSGGTFCYEAMLLLKPVLGPIYSNVPLRPDHKLILLTPRSALPASNVCLDLGADEFTVGRPHPMIDMSLRAERMMLEAEEPEVAVLMLDVVLGYGAHPDPAGALAPAIRQAKAIAEKDGRGLPVVVSICGTDHDPQGYDAQREVLEAAGVIVAPSNATAARLAGEIAKR